MRWKYELFMGTYYLWGINESERTRSLGAAMDEVAIAVDIEDLILLKHGRPEAVNTWFQKAIKKYEASGLGDMASKIRMIQGKFKVEELNRLLDTTGYLAKFLEAHHLDLQGLPIQEEPDESTGSA